MTEKMKKNLNDIELNKEQLGNVTGGVLAEVRKDKKKDDPNNALIGGNKKDDPNNACVGGNKKDDPKDGWD